MTMRAPVCIVHDNPWNPDHQVRNEKYLGWLGFTRVTLYYTVRGGFSYTIIRLPDVYCPGESRSKEDCNLEHHPQPAYKWFFSPL